MIARFQMEWQNVKYSVWYVYYLTYNNNRKLSLSENFNPVFTIAFHLQIGQTG